MRRMLLALCLGALLTACGSNSSPTSPATTTTTPTRIISLSGNMDFGNIQVGSSFPATLTIRNAGNAPLTVSGMSAPNASTGVFTSSFTSGTIAPGASQDATIRFNPTLAQTYSGVLTVTADQTSGTNTIPISGTGSLNGIGVFTKSGTGDQVFDLPPYVTKIRIQASSTTSCQNFVVKVRGTLIVNIILGTCSVADARTIDNTYAITGGGTVETQISTGINWSFTEVR